MIQFDFKGKAKTLNKMIEYCKYDWVALLDVDDKWATNKLEYQIPYTTNYDIIGTGCQYFGDKDITIDIPIFNITNCNFLKGNPIINSSVILKKSICLWDDTTILEDYDLWLRMKLEGKKFFNIPTTLVYHRIHKDSAFNNTNNN